MNSSDYHGISREKIAWFPTIDYEKCLSCLACVGFCKKDVYAEEDGKPIVKNPYNCTVGCTGCEKICPAKAISHPSKAYLVDLLKEKYQSEKAKTLTITWRRLLQNQETCPRCGSTEKELEKAVAELQKQNVEVVLEKEELSLKEFQKNPDQSNQILINGKLLENWLEAKTGHSKCCGVCGDTECRTVEIGSSSYEIIPAKMIVEAGIKALN